MIMPCCHHQDALPYAVFVLEQLTDVIPGGEDDEKNVGHWPVTAIDPAGTYAGSARIDI